MNSVANPGGADVVYTTKELLANLDRKLDGFMTEVRLAISSKADKNEVERRLIKLETQAEDLTLSPAGRSGLDKLKEITEEISAIKAAKNEDTVARRWLWGLAITTILGLSSLTILTINLINTMRH